MQTVADASTVDLTRTRIRICEGVTFTPQRYGDESFYHVETSAKSQFFRIGYTEYVFLSLLDGRASFCEALALTAQTLGPDALPQEQALSVYTWALEQNVASFAEGDSAKPTTAKPPTSNPLQKYNPFWIRIPLGRPDPLLNVLQPVIGWLFSPLATLVGGSLMLAALIRLWADWDQFTAASENVFAPENWVWLLLAWIVLKSVHEIAHGLVCRRYGGTVKETGIILAFFAPLAYVDVTSCWAFRSRWQRIHTAVAGMYVELLLASVAVFTWTQFRSDVASHLLYNVIVMASVSTLLFNANPLMRFDGYYVLADLLQIPNLYTESSVAIRRTASRFFFGIRSTAPTTGGGQAWILNTYGAAAFAWRLFICFTMALAASALFHGAGIMLSIMAMLAWFAVPIVKTAQHGLKMLQASPARGVRGALLVSATVVLLVGLFWWLPVPFSNTAPGVVALPDGRVIRSEVAGFVDQIHVTDGQHVLEGELLITLRNEEITAEYNDLLLEQQQETVRYQTALKEHDAGTAKVARGNLLSLEERLQEASQQASALQIRASATGVVVARQLETRLSSYIDEGEELMLVDDNQPRELRVSVAQQDFAELESKIGQHVPVRLGTRSQTTGIVKRVIPRASRRLRFQSLAATEGGSLPVVAYDDEEGEPQAELTEQRFEAIVQLGDAASAADHAVGERGYIALPSAHKSLGRHLYYSFRDWLQTQIADATRAARG